MKQFGKVENIALHRFERLIARRATAQSYLCYEKYTRIDISGFDGFRGGGDPFYSSTLVGRASKVLLILEKNP